eukprot:SAG31_NODE_1521_length_8022_cov_17.832261_7_plen_325_part_00
MAATMAAHSLAPLLLETLAILQVLQTSPCSASPAGAGGDSLSRTVFAPPALITTDGSSRHPNWLTGYADAGVRLDDDNLLWQTTPGRHSALEYGAPVYRSTDRGESWDVVHVADQTFITSPVPTAAAGRGALGQAVRAALRGWGQLAADPCSPNGTDNAPPNDLAGTWSFLTSDTCWQVPCHPPQVFGVSAATGDFVIQNFTDAPLTIDLAGHTVWCYNQTMNPAMVMSVSGNIGPLQDGSVLQTLSLFWGGGKARPDIPGAAGSPQHPQSWGNFSKCSNINGRVPKDWTPYFPQSSIVVLRSAAAPFTAWTLHGVVANASDYP